MHNMIYDGCRVGIVKQIIMFEVLWEVDGTCNTDIHSLRPGLITNSVYIGN